MSESMTNQTVAGIKQGEKPMKSAPLQTAMWTAFGLTLLMASPAIAQVQLGTPGVGVGVGSPDVGRSSAPASRYAMPPTRMTPPSALSGVNLEKASLDDLGEVIDGMENALSECQSTARRLNMELSSRRNQDAVHPDWIKSYQDCLQQQDKDISKVRETLQTHDGDGQRIADLSDEIEDLEDELDEAFSTQRRLVSEYNFSR
jgi:hypothetical protein